MTAVDNDLIRACQSGDKPAFARLLHLVYDMIFRFALKWAGSAADAEDITQQACIKLAKVIKQFRFESAFSSWLYRLVVNCAHDWGRSQARHKAEPADDDEAHSSAHSIEAETELERVLIVVDRMGKGFKETLLLVYSEGFTHKEAADILSLKESTVSWRLHEIRKQLAQYDASHSVVEGV